MYTQAKPSHVSAGNLEPADQLIAQAFPQSISKTRKIDVLAQLGSSSNQLTESKVPTLDELLKIREHHEEYGTKLSSLVGALGEASATKIHSFLMDSSSRALSDREKVASELKQIVTELDDAFRLRGLSKFAASRKEALMYELSKRVQEITHPTLKDTEGQLVTRPTIIRRWERDFLLLPALRDILNQAVPRDRREEATLVDVGAWDGGVSLALQDYFGSLVAMEPDQHRFEMLQERYERARGTELRRVGYNSYVDGSKTARQYRTYNLDVRTAIEGPLQFPEHADVMLMSHVLYFLQKDEWDHRAINWALERLNTDGLLILVLNDIVPEKGSRAHLRREVVGTEVNPGIGRYEPILNNCGAETTVFRPCLELCASGEQGLVALRDIARYFLPGASRHRLQDVQAYLDKYVKDRNGAGQHQLDFRSAILVARKTANTRYALFQVPAVEDVFEYVRIQAAPQEEIDAIKKVETDQLLLDFKADSENLVIRNELVERHLRYIEQIARKLSSKLPPSSTLEFEDFVAAGVEGLVEALLAYEPARGVKFTSFFPLRVRGAMLDNMRKVDWVPRLERTKEHLVRSKFQELERDKGRPVTLDEVQKAFSLSPELIQAFHTLCQKGKVTSLYDGYDNPNATTDRSARVTTLSSHADKKAPDPSAGILDEVLRARILRGCSQQERVIFVMYHELGVPMVEIGAQLELSESRVSQMHSAMMDRLSKEIEMYLNQDDSLADWLGIQGREDVVQKLKLSVVVDEADGKHADIRDFDQDSDSEIETRGPQNDEGREEVSSEDSDYGDFSALMRKPPKNSK